MPPTSAPGRARHLNQARKPNIRADRSPEEKSGGEQKIGAFGLRNGGARADVGPAYIGSIYT